MKFSVSPIWTGERVVIIGGGPSLSLEQVHAIARAKMAGVIRVIAVNNAVYVAWWADWLHACDSIWWHRHYPLVHRFPGLKTTLANDLPDEWGVGELVNTGKYGFDEDPGNCRTGGNSVYQAMHIAIHAGVKEIILVGVDMKRDGARTHWHDGHRGPDVDYATTMAPCFEDLVPVLGKRGIKAVNASPNSALKTFPAVALQNLL